MSGKSLFQKFRRILRYSLISAGSLILLVILLLFFASTPPGEGILRKIMQGQLSSAMYQTVRIGRLETDILSRLHLEDISISAPDTAAVGVEIGSVRISYSLIPLLSRTISIDSLHVESAYLNMVKDSSGDYNIQLLDSLTASKREDSTELSGEETGWHFETGSVRVEGADISYSDINIPVSLRLKQLSLRAGSSPEKPRYIHLENDSGTVWYRDFRPASIKLFSRAEMRDNRIITDSTSIALDSLILSVEGSVKSSGAYPAEIDLILRGAPPAMLNLLAGHFHSGAPAVHGAVLIEAGLSGPLTSLRGELKCSMERVEYRGLTFRDNYITAGRFGDTLSVDTLRTMVAGGSASGEGTVITANRLRGDAALLLESVRLDQISSILPGQRKSLGGSVSGSLKAGFAGDSWGEWSAEARLSADNLSYGNRILDKAELLAGYKDRQLSIEFRHQDADLKGKAFLGDSTLEGSVRADIDRLEILSALPGRDKFRGSAQLQADIKGSYGNPSVMTRLELEEASVGGIDVDTLRLWGRSMNRRLILDSLCLYCDTLLLKAAGDFNLESTEGVFSAGFFSGSASESERGSAEVPGRLYHLCRPPGPYKLNGYLDTRFSLAGTGSFYFSGLGKGIELGALIPVVNDSIDIDGTAEFELTARGPVDSLTADLRMGILNPKYRKVRFDSLLLMCTFDRGNLLVSRINLSRAGQSVRGRFNLKLERDTSMYWIPAPGSPTSGELEIESFDLEVLNPALPEGKEVGGLVWMNLRWNGTPYHLNPAGSLRVKSASFGTGGEASPPVRDINIDIAVLDSMLILERGRAVVGGMPVSMNGRVSLEPGDRLGIDLSAGIDTFRAVQVKGTLSGYQMDMFVQIDSLDLRIMEPMLPKIQRIEGSLSAGINLKGTPAEPDLTGNIRGAGIEVLPSVLDRPLTGGFLSGRFDGSRIHIDTLSAGLGEGWLEVSGSAAVDSSGISDISLAAAGGRLGFVMNEDLELQIDSLNLAWQPDGDYYWLRGSIDPGMVRYSRDIQPASIMPFAREVRKVETEMPGLLARTRLDINISGADSIWIDNNLAELRAAPDVSISGFMSRPNLSGRLKVEEGHITYLDREFRIEEGVAIFADPEGINPDITLKAATEVTTYQRTESIDYRIIFMITGTAEDPTVELSSQPPLPRPDIVSILTLGATRAQLSGETGEVLQQRGEVLASQRISSYASQKLGQTLGLDRVTVTGNIFKREGKTSPELIVTKEMSEGVTVTYRTRVGHLNEQKIGLNWELSRHWTVGGTTTRMGKSSISLTYSLRFR